MSKIVVLGGAGFIGRHIVHRLAAHGESVWVPSRHRERAKHLIMLPTVQVLDADIHNQAELDALCRGAEAVINLVGILNERRRGEFTDAHPALVEKIVSACRANDIARLLHMSALNASVAGASDYMRSKGQAEKIIMQSGLAWTIFQPSIVFGREDKFLNLFACLLKWFPMLALGCPDARFQPIYVDDLAHVVVRSLRDPRTIGQRYPLCGPTMYSLQEIVTLVGEITGHRRHIIPLGRGLSTLQAIVLEHLPGKLMSRDNLASMEQASVCDCPFPALFGITPQALEAIVPSYLAPAASRDRYAEYRQHSHR